MKLTALHAFNGLAEAEREWAIMKCLEIAKRHGCSSYFSQVKVRQNSSKRLLAQRTSTLWLCTSPDIVCTCLGERASGSREPCILHNILHYTLYYTTLYTILHYTTLYYTLLYYTTTLYTTLDTTIHYTIYYTLLHYTIHYTTLYF